MGSPHQLKNEKQVSSSSFVLQQEGSNRVIHSSISQKGVIVTKKGKYQGKVPLHDKYGPEAKYAVEAEALLPTTKYEEEVARGLELGLQGADSIKDRRIPTFSRGELPHFARINTFN